MKARGKQGRPPSRDAKWKGQTLCANQIIPSSIGKFNLSANWYHNGGYATDPDNRLRERPYSLLSGSISWSSTDDRYEVSIWAKNLTNAEYYSHLTETGPGDVGIPAPPRTFGVSLGVKL